jgi:3-methylcrotonyl-CoA carboxylase alpha subunit
MMKKLLIANRGEIACRIIRTAHRMGIATVAVYSDADADAMHVRAAGESVHIGPSAAADSYLRIDQVLAAAKATGADAIHPGYGFLAENADFADACKAAGLAFVGPSGSAMRKLGGKAEAKVVARAAGVPVVPGYDGDKQDARTLASEAARIGYPVMIKAVAGGGGRGMRLVEKAGDFAAALESAVREATSSFGNGAVLIEKVVVAPRHVEIQVFGDRHGNAVHLFERDCSLQRRNQKVIEEAPAPDMSQGLRDKMTSAAVKLAKAVGYEGAGTVEFLVEGGTLRPEAPWYFIEMNTRLQVEHPVTEAITGLDLVEWQLRVASGERLPLAQDAIRMQGHAIEVRLCAEDPASGFLPSIGRIVAFHAESGAGEARIDTGFRTGDTISPFYDSLLAKLIVHAPDRKRAITNALRSLGSCRIAGLKTNAGFLAALLGHSDVVAGRLDTGLIGREIEALTRSRVTPAERAAAAGHLLAVGREATRPGAPFSPWSATDAFTLGPPRRMRLPVVIDGRPIDIEARWSEGSSTPAVMLAGVSGDAGTVRTHDCFADGDGVFVLFELEQVEARWPTYDAETEDGPAGGAVRAPINGKVARLFVSPGAVVAKGDRIAIVEAMKMEHVLAASAAGTVAEVRATEGDQVTTGQLIARIDEAAS